MWECCGRCWGLGCNLASAATTLPLPVHNHNPLTPLYLTPTHSLTPICALPVAKVPTLARRAVDLCCAPPRPRALTEAGSGQPCVQVRPREGLCHHRPNMSHPASRSNCSDSPRKRQLLQISATCLQIEQTVILVYVTKFSLYQQGNRFSSIMPQSMVKK